MLLSILLVVEEFGSSLLHQARGHSSTRWRHVTALIVGLELGVVDNCFKELLLSLELVRMVEQNMPVLLEPVFGFDSHGTKHDQVHNRDQ